MDDNLAGNSPLTRLILRPPSREQSVAPLFAEQSNLSRVVRLRSAVNLKVGGGGVARRATNSMRIGREKNTQK